MILDRIADSIISQVDAAQAAVQEAFFEPVIRLGVTGPSRSGKTVFITSLVSNLLNRTGMPGLRAAAEGRILAAYLQPQPDDLVPRFDYEANLAAMSGPNAHWTAGTERISELRVSMRVAPSGLLGSIRGARRVHIDIVDYPGEWLLDLGLLDLDYASWSDGLAGRLHERQEAARFRELVQTCDAQAPHDETSAQKLAQEFSGYLQRAREAGFYDTTPGRFLLPGDLAGSPALTFAPLPDAARAQRGSLGREMARRFEAYKAQVVKPFFRNHFARIDRQIVVIDPLSALADGPRALADLEAAMAATLEAFRPGQNGFLQAILRGRRIDRILFAATKADVLHHSQHDALTALAGELLRGARGRAAFAGAETRAMAIAALRTTAEETRDGLGMVVGRIEGRERPVAAYPGTLPASPTRLVAEAKSGRAGWEKGAFSAPKFLPRPDDPKPDHGLPHIRLDRAAEFLLGDRL